MASGKPHKPPKHAHDRRPHHKPGKPLTQQTHEEMNKVGEGCLMYIVLGFIICIIIYLIFGSETILKWLSLLFHHPKDPS